MVGSAQLTFEQGKGKKEFMTHEIMAGYRCRWIPITYLSRKFHFAHVLAGLCPGPEWLPWTAAYCLSLPWAAFIVEQRNRKNYERQQRAQYCFSKLAKQTPRGHVDQSSESNMDESLVSFIIVPWVRHLYIRHVSVWVFLTMQKRDCKVTQC